MINPAAEHARSIAESRAEERRKRPKKGPIALDEAAPIKLLLALPQSGDLKVRIRSEGKS